MKRWRANLMIAGLGIAGSSLSAQENGWRSVALPPLKAGTPTPSVPLAAPVSTPLAPTAPLPAAIPQAMPATTNAPLWQPVRGAPEPVRPLPVVEGQPQFRAATQPLIPEETPRIETPPRVETPPRIEVAPPNTEVPRIEGLPNVTVPVFADPERTPPPRLQPGTPTPTEPLPLPRPVNPDATNLPVAPAPRLLPEKSGSTTTPNTTAPAANPAAQRIWGASNGDGTELEPDPNNSIVPAGAVMPQPRHGTFGSRNLTLSRDHHFLDLFGLSLFADDSDTMILGEGLATDRYFVQTEYLLWWVNQAYFPVLATTGSGSSLGFLGQPGTQNLLGPGTFASSPRSGFRVRAGAWLDGFLDGCGIDGSYFVLGQQTNSFAAGSNQYPLITRPFFAPNTDPTTGRVVGEFGEQVAFPGRAAGFLQVNSLRELWGADVNFRKCVCRTCFSSSEWFFGYRHLNLHEQLTINETIDAIGKTNQPVGTRVFVQDQFDTRNQFNGAQIGYAVGRQNGRLSLDARASIALGSTHQQVTIQGTQQVYQPGVAPLNFTNGGLLAAGPNIGTFSRDRFSAVPEFTLNVGYMATPRTKLYVGYNLLYWPNVVRPGDQIDRVVDLTNIPNFTFPQNGAAPTPSGLVRPQPTFAESDLWVQGIQFGMEYRW